jgi:hypothetical protein
MEGQVLPDLGIESRRESMPVYVQCGEKLAVRFGDYKLITDISASSAVLYDLARDAGETTDILAREPGTAAALQQYAAEYWRRSAGTGTAAATTPGTGSQALDPATKERLRALGYLP